MNWEYLAGLYDGEGSGNIYWNDVARNWFVIVQISNTNEELLMRVADFLEDHEIDAKVYQNRLIIGTWKSVVLFCGQIWKYLIAKKVPVCLLYKACRAYICYRKAVNYARGVQVHLRDHPRPDVELKKLSLKISSFSTKGRHRSCCNLP